MREVKRAALLDRPPGEMFALINDIESYPSFLPWCTHARIESRAPDSLVATLGVRQGSLAAELTTRNTFSDQHRIHMQLLRGPFRQLDGEWLLTGIPGGGCRIELTMRFAFANPLTAMLFESKFALTVGSLVDAFVARARAPRA
jgi:ribosome-associated toxin RatA of RatAB toxin-antitoxin module